MNLKTYACIISISRCDQFLIGDVIVDAARHIMFGSPTQLQILQNARRWYIDGTFKIVRKPFKQLFTIHAFIQKEDSIKQVIWCLS